MGSVLSGRTVESTGWAGFFASAVHLIPATAEREFLGWITPQLGKFSFHRAFLAGFGVGTKTFKMTPALQGGHRAIIPFGKYEDVVATPDVQPQFLFRSISAGDMEDSIKLGMLDISEEEAALMTYICPSKIEYDVLLREGLESFEKEN
jgi:Na+-transporting NADH:ubiquinone oxidoreductase subunit A